MGEIAKLMIVGGLALAAAGVLLLAVGRLTGGGLPGDIVVERKSFTLVFPIVTCLVISVVATLIVNLFFRR